ncbi:hypothetical protein SAMN04487902_11453 [Prevotella sp. ne3005]|uniref:hypothetical protein n=1 Tax=Prevotella sp. ne3005 TaxID=1761887 RepID=UPI0008D7EE16|nr:hypothetical protein [Prevotella sp. ne3005]SEN37980.1 hypothetical protein SAMN04487902_11453 [Prevotella sp. ne3005]
MENLGKEHVAPVNNFFGNINNYNVYNAPVNYNGSVYNQNGIEEEDTPSQETDEKPVPTFSQMMKVFETTYHDGFWSSNRSWGVGFQIWQNWGFNGTIKDFVKLVQNSEEAKRFEHDCNLDAVYKMFSKGHLSRRLDNWRKDGVLEPYIILGERMDRELQKMFPTTENEV